MIGSLREFHVSVIHQSAVKIKTVHTFPNLYAGNVNFIATLGLHFI